MPQNNVITLENLAQAIKASDISFFTNNNIEVIKDILLLEDDIFYEDVPEHLAPYSEYDDDEYLISIKAAILRLAASSIRENPSANSTYILKYLVEKINISFKETESDQYQNIDSAFCSLAKANLDNASHYQQEQMRQLFFWIFNELPRDKRPDINYRFNGWIARALDEACENKSLFMVKLLLEHGAATAALNVGGRVINPLSALFYGADLNFSQNIIKIAKLLLMYGARPGVLENKTEITELLNTLQDEIEVDKNQVNPTAKTIIREYIKNGGYVSNSKLNLNLSHQLPSVFLQALHTKLTDKYKILAPTINKLHAIFEEQKKITQTQGSSKRQKLR